MHATADSYRTSGAKNALRQQLDKIAAREGQLREASAVVWADYTEERDKQRAQRQRAQIGKPEPAQEKPPVRRYEEYTPGSQTEEEFQRADEARARTLEAAYQRERHAEPPAPARPVQPIDKPLERNTAPIIRAPQDAPDRTPRARSQANATRRATVATAAAPASQAPPELPGLDAAVEALVRQHTAGAVIDAAWAASARLFKPQGGRA
jgi:hypothetical protein